MILDFLIGKVETEKCEEEVYKIKFKYKGIFDAKELYSNIYNWFLEGKWVDDQIETDKYEKYYYEKVTKEGLRFIEFQFIAKKTFHKEAPKIENVLKITVVISAYDSNKKVGSIDFDIRGIIRYEKIKASSKLANIFGKIWEKSTLKTLEREAKKALYMSVFGLRDFIIKYLKGYTFR